VGVTDAVTIFPLLWEKTRQKMNFLVWEMSLLPFLTVIKEVVVGGATSGIMNSPRPSHALTQTPSNDFYRTTSLVQSFSLEPSHDFARTPSYDFAHLVVWPSAFACPCSNAFERSFRQMPLDALTMSFGRTLSHDLRLRFLHLPRLSVLAQESAYTLPNFSPLQVSLPSSSHEHLETSLE